MAFNFFGVYFEGADGTEYRCGFTRPSEYQPKLYVRRSNIWIEVKNGGVTGSAKKKCDDIRNQLPITIPFPPNAHTQNQRLELINQIIYNINRNTTQHGNYGGAHM